MALFDNTGNEVLQRMLYILNCLLRLMAYMIIDVGIVSFFCVFRSYFMLINKGKKDYDKENNLGIV